MLVDVDMFNKNTFLEGPRLEVFSRLLALDVCRVEPKKLGDIIERLSSVGNLCGGRFGRDRSDLASLLDKFFYQFLQVFLLVQHAKCRLRPFR